MATNTYVALDKKTLVSAVSSVTFTGIPSTYTDLVIVGQGTMATGSGAFIALQFNGDTTANYSNTRIYGNGSAAGSLRDTNQTSGVVGAMYSGIANFVCNIQNYANTTTYKTIVSRNSAPTSGEASEYATLWRKSPEAITSITVVAQTDNMAIGTTFSLYGIRAEGTSPAPKAIGGSIYSDSTYYYHVFGSTGTFTPASSLTADVLCLAGGGGGGRATGGGGGAGGLTYYASQSLTATGYAITVGAGGAGSTTGNNENSLPGSSGGNSQFGALTASAGGGGGGSRISNNGTAYYTTTNVNGIAGGSGGGASGNVFNGTNGTGGSATPSGQGNAGGVSFQSAINSGGGGGAGAVGAAATSLAGGNGGVGSGTYSSWLSVVGMGVDVSGTRYIAGGGGGGANGSNAQVQPGTGGNGGGGYGAINSGTGGNGTIYTGSGAGGGGIADGGLRGNGGNGASGFVIVRYLKA